MSTPTTLNIIDEVLSIFDGPAGNLHNHKDIHKLVNIQPTVLKAASRLNESLPAPIIHLLGGQSIDHVLGPGSIHY